MKHNTDIAHFSGTFDFILSIPSAATILRQLPRSGGRCKKQMKNRDFSGLKRNRTVRTLCLSTKTLCYASSVFDFLKQVHYLHTAVFLVCSHCRSLEYL